MDDEEYLAYALKHLAGCSRISIRPGFASTGHGGRVTRNRSPSAATRRTCPEHNPFANTAIATMAQIYPEDRGTNYAIRDGRAAAERLSRVP